MSQSIQSLVKRAISKRKNGLSISRLSQITSKSVSSVRTAVYELEENGIVKRLVQSSDTKSDVRGRPATIFVTA